MSEAEYSLLLGWSAERIEAQGLTESLAWAVWAHTHPILTALLLGIVLSLCA